MSASLIYTTNQRKFHNYMAVHIGDGKAYVGKSHIGESYTIETRKNNHVRLAMSGSTRCPVFYNAIRDHGPENFKWYKLYETHDEDLAYKMEKFFIKLYNTNVYQPNSHGYNCNDGGKGVPSGTKLTQEHKNKIGKANSGKKASQETKDMMSKARIGIKLSQETKDRMSKAGKGRKLSQEWKDNLSKALKNPSQETLDKMSKSYIIIYPNKETKQIHNLKKFCRENGLNAGHMYTVAKGKRKQHKGFGCEYA